MTQRAFFPPFQQIRLAFATAVLLSYTWMIFVFFYSLPAWQNIIPTGEILAVFAYGCATALLESLGLVGLLLVVAWLLPRKWFFERFAIQASATALWLAPWQILIRMRFTYYQTFSYAQVIPVLLILLASVVYFNFMVYRFKPLAKFMTRFAERATVFTVIYAPIGVFGLAVVIWRNLS